jgi:hypothetical protein
MIVPLLVATSGHLPCRSPSKLSVSGFLGVCGTAAVEEEVVTGGGAGRKQPQYDYLAQAQREDEELLQALAIIVMKINS